MIYENNFNFGSSMLESDLSVDPTYGQYEIASEAMQTEHDIFMRMMDQDFAESFNRINPSLVTESQLMSIQENAITDIFKRLIDFIVKIGKKLMGILDNIITKIKMLCTKDGKDLVNKYKKRAFDNYNSGRMSEVKFKVRYFKNEIDFNHEKLPAWTKLGEFDTALKNIKNKVHQKHLHDDDINDDNEKAVVNTSKALNQSKPDKYNLDTELFKHLSEDQKTEIKEQSLKQICGGTNTDEKNFRKDYLEYLLEDEDEKEGTEFNLSGAIKILTDYSKRVSEFNKQKRETDKKIKNRKKEFEDMQKEFSKDLMKGSAAEGASLAKKAMNIYAGKCIACCNIASSCIATAYSVALEAVKIEYKYAKANFIKCATFGGKKESVEESALMREISDYEVDMILA